MRYAFEQSVDIHYMRIRRLFVDRDTELMDVPAQWIKKGDHAEKMTALVSLKKHPICR
jgi:hypothetical protein